MNEKFLIRFMTVEDIDQVLEVEHNSFTTPWSRIAFVNELTTNKFSRYLVVEYDNRIIGYCGLWIIIDEAHITNIAIHSDFRGKKLGKQLLVYAMSLSKTLGAKKMTLEVRVSNYAAQSLYTKLGFQPGAVRKNYYTDNQEDALVMWVMLDENN